MRSLIAIGEKATLFAESLKDYPEYTSYCFRHGHKEDCFSVPVFSEAQRYEEPLVDLEEFLKGCCEDVTAIISGDEAINLTALQILEVVKNKNIEILFFKPDQKLLGTAMKQINNLTYNVLQEYTRSGLFGQMFIFDLGAVDQVASAASLQSFEKVRMEFVAGHYHTLNWLRNSEAVAGTDDEHQPVNCLASIGVTDLELSEIKMLNKLDFVRERVYYYGIPEKKVKEDAGLRSKILEGYKKNMDENISSSFKIYSIPFKQELVYVVEYTSAVQNKELKKLLTEHNK